MEIEEKARIIEVLKMMREDIKKDVEELEGSPFTGRNVAKMFGLLSAIIATQADILKRILEDN